MSKQRITGDSLKAYERLCQEGGFSLLQLMVTAAVMATIGAFALMGISSARANMRLAGSARKFAAYVEKARIDAVRRHVSSAAPTRIEFPDDRTYRVTMDFDGSGITATRDFKFEDGVTLLSNAPQPITFDWRGRMTACTASFSMVSSQSGTSPVNVDVTASGDVTVDSDIDDFPANINYSNINQTSDISTDATVKGTTAPAALGALNCGAVDAGPVGGVTGGGGPTCGTINVNPGKITIKRNNGSTASFSVTVSNAVTITAGGPSNLVITPSSKAMTSAAAATFTVKSINKATGDFAVTFSSNCGTASVTVKVTK
jgi:Tfp pilus assembly protein FimT